MSLLFFILISTLVFTSIIFLLVGLLSVVEAKVVNKKGCKLQVNDGEEPLTVASGKNLLLTLSDNNIFLPSACGGIGTCALCKCEVLEGGGEVLPTEKALLSRKEIKENNRLACQLKVRNDIKIHLPESILNVKKYESTVELNKNVASFIKEVVLKLPDGENFDFKPGEYIQLYAPPYNISFSQFDIPERFKGDWEKYKLFNLYSENEEENFKAYSMANYPKEGNVIKLNVRIATPPSDNMGFSPGVVSSYIFNLKPKDKVTISGPYGEYLIRDTDREMVYIGGGAGMAPIRSHLFHLFHTLRTNRKVSFWYGARSKSEIFYEQEFMEIANKFSNFHFNIGLSEPKPEDGWKGYTGFIHNVVYENYLKNHKEPEEVEYYLCGPPLMIDAVNKMLDSLGVAPEMIIFDKF